MSFRTTGAVTILLIGLGAGPVLAQFLPPPPAPILPPPFRQLPPADVDDEAAPPYDPPPGYRMPPPGTYSPQPGPYDNQARGADPGYMPPGQQYGRGPSAQDPDYPPGGWREPPPLPGADPGDPRDRTGSQNYGAPPTYGSNQPYGNQPYGNQPPPPYDDRQQASRPLLPNPLDILRPPGSIGGREQPAGTGREQDSAVMASLPPDVRPETGPAKALPPQFRRTLVDYRTKEPAGTIIIDTPNTYLYLVLGNGKAMRYGIGVGREGFTWAGAEKVSRMAEWPDWHPPVEMIERQPYLPRFMAGGEGNPLGARALYLGKTLYRIHGTNQPSTIGTFVSSGCIRLTNEDVSDLYTRVQVGTRVVVLPGRAPVSASAASPNDQPSGPYNPLAPPRAR